jgi:hypothetical protein
MSEEYEQIIGIIIVLACIEVFVVANFCLFSVLFNSLGLL